MFTVLNFQVFHDCCCTSSETDICWPKYLLHSTSSTPNVWQGGRVFWRAKETHWLWRR